MLPKTWPNTKRRQLVMLYRNGDLTKTEVMKKLKLGRDYHAFNALFHNCTMADFKE